uniref:Uncharacterized protein n=1 Tax=Cercocebus atys TaxID=9531 RepID=A0A2K5LHA1_CERAT
VPGKVLPEKSALMWPHLGMRAPQRPMRESWGFPGCECRTGQAPPCRAHPPAPAPSHPSSSLSLTPGPGSPRQTGPPCPAVAALYGLGAWQSRCGGGVGRHGRGRQLNPYPVASPGLFHTRSCGNSHSSLGSPGTRPSIRLFRSCLTAGLSFICGWQLLTSSGGLDGRWACTLGRTGRWHRPEQVASAHEKGVSETGCLSQRPGVDEADEWP